MLRVLHVTTDTNYGGVQEVVLAICRHASSDFKHFVLRLRQGKLEKKFAGHATLLDAARRFEHSIVEAIRNSGADLLHVHLPGGTCPRWLLMASETGIPIVESIHCVFAALPHEEAIASARIVASEHAACLQRTREKLHVIPHPISVDGLAEELRPETRIRRRSERCQRLGIPENGVAIGRLGNITPWKRLQDFIGAVPLILAWTKECSLPLSFSIAGSSHDSPELLTDLQQFAIKLGVGDHIRFLGDIPNKYAYLSMLDVFLYPTSKETYCIAAAEAMAMGALVISYRESAMPETVGNCGILVDSGNLQALAAAAVEYLKNPSAWLSLRASASQKALSRNLPEVVIPQYEQVYRAAAR